MRSAPRKYGHAIHLGRVHLSVEFAGCHVVALGGHPDFLAAAVTRQLGDTPQQTRCNSLPAQVFVYRNLIDVELGGFIGVHDHGAACEAHDHAPFQCHDHLVYPGGEESPGARRVDFIVEGARAHAIKNMSVLWTEISNGDWVC